MMERKYIFTVLAPVAAVIIAFFLTKYHDDNLNLTSKIDNIEKSQISSATKAEIIYKIELKTEANVNSLKNDFYNIYSNFYTKKEIEDQLNAIENKFSSKMASTGNVMYSDRQELFYLIYNNTELLQYISGKLHLNNIENSNHINKVKLPYDNYESLK